jgi:hypothetical protein
MTHVSYGSGGSVAISCVVPPPTDASPVYSGLSVSGSLALATFSKPVCRDVSWSSSDWTVTINGMPTPVVGDNLPFDCDDAVASASVQLVVAAPPGALVIMTLNMSGGTAIRDTLGQGTVAPQTQTATATAPETIRPTILSASASVGSTTITFVFSEAVFCTGLSFDASDMTISDSIAGTSDPLVVGAGSNSCGFTPVSADTSISVITNAAFPADSTFTVTFTAEPNEIQDVVGNDLSSPATVTFTTGAGDFSPPTIVEARLAQNVGTSDFTDAGDAFTLTFSETMTANDEVGFVSIQDQDGTVLALDCTGFGVTCTWNIAKTTVTVTLAAFAPPPLPGMPGGGITPGMQIPFNVTTLSGPSFTDLQGNAPSVLGSSDRLVDYTTSAGDAPPTMVDALIVDNVGSSDFSETGDAFTLTLSETMTDNDEVGAIALQDQDGTVLTLDCASAAVACNWNTAKTTVTVTLQTFAAPPFPGIPGGGSTPGMQIPFNVTTMSGSSFTDVQGNAVNVLGSTDRLVDFTTGAGDFSPPTIVDARVATNLGTSDFTDAGDAFTLAFSEAMTDTDEVGAIALQDQDGTVLTLDCATAVVGCTWNTAATTVTVTLQAAAAPPPPGTPSSGTTPGMQIPFNVITLSGSSFTDLQGNAVNVFGSSDRLVDFE